VEYDDVEDECDEVEELDRLELETSDETELLDVDEVDTEDPEDEEREELELLLLDRDDEEELDDECCDEEVERLCELDETERDETELSDWLDEDESCWSSQNIAFILSVPSCDRCRLRIRGLVDCSANWPRNVYIDNSIPGLERNFHWNFEGRRTGTTRRLRSA